jgi:hypothetical protein
MSVVKAVKYYTRLNLSVGVQLLFTGTVVLLSGIGTVLEMIDKGTNFVVYYQKYKKAFAQVNFYTRWFKYDRDKL